MPQKFERFKGGEDGGGKEKDTLNRVLPRHEIPGTPLYPNEITGIGFLATAVSLAVHRVLHELNPVVGGTIGAVLNGLTYLTDFIDGKKARSHPRLQTQEGAKLDPLVDKLRNVMQNLYIISLNLDYTRPENWALWASMLANWKVDLESQLMRGPKRLSPTKNLMYQIREGVKAVVDAKNGRVDTSENPHKAVWQGKWKTGLQIGVNVSLLAEDLWYWVLKELGMTSVEARSMVVRLSAAGVLGVAVYLGYRGKKSRAQRASLKGSL